MARKTRRRTQKRSRRRRGKSARKRRGKSARKRRSRHHRGGAVVGQELSPSPVENVDPPVAKADGGEDTAPVAKQDGGRRRKTSKKGKKGKRKMNAYFKIMLKSKKAGAASFQYKGRTYKGRKHNRLGMIYKKA